MECQRCGTEGSSPSHRLTDVAPIDISFVLVVRFRHCPDAASNAPKAMAPAAGVATKLNGTATIAPTMNPAAQSQASRPVGSLRRLGYFRRMRRGFALVGGVGLGEAADVGVVVAGAEFGGAGGGVEQTAGVAGWRWSRPRRR